MPTIIVTGMSGAMVHGATYKAIIKWTIKKINTTEFTIEEYRRFSKSLLAALMAVPSVLEGKKH